MPNARLQRRRDLLKRGVPVNLDPPIRGHPSPVNYPLAGLRFTLISDTGRSPCRLHVRKAMSKLVDAPVDEPGHSRPGWDELRCARLRCVVLQVAGPVITEVRPHALVTCERQVCARIGDALVYLVQHRISPSGDHAALRSLAS